MTITEFPPFPPAPASSPSPQAIPGPPAGQLASQRKRKPMPYLVAVVGLTVALAFVGFSTTSSSTPTRSSSTPTRSSSTESVSSSGGHGPTLSERNREWGEENGYVLTDLADASENLGYATTEPIDLDEVYSA